ncbi:PRC and DUF2382 domain-containing protein [Actinomadura atramentaria]|uniref:PRC and DUF2382 domain-containing protein n=1 Tax=Actinomadura atramentaria TaxID=1990 RepID=UPI000475D276|nr:PRC and DUF2382 domain-containing protein [Actinomadura atramentaria]
MKTRDRVRELMNTTVTGRDGTKIGTVRQIYLNDRTGLPEWVTVHTGWFGNRESFVPITDATRDQDGLRVPFDRQLIKDAPHVHAGQHLSPQEINDLYRYYGLRTPDRPREQAQAEMKPAGPDGTRPGRPDQPAADRADQGEPVEVVRSEERMSVSKREEETGRVRIRKSVDTELERMEVEVGHEEIQIEREPITDGRPGGAALEPSEQEIILHEERIVVNKEAVPVERVVIRKQTVADKRTVEDEVRKERIDIVAPDDPRAH